MSKGRVRFLRTPNHHGYSVKFSPFDPNLIAAATGQNFGLSGGGKLITADLGLPGDSVLCCFDWKDALFDLTWSEQNPHNIVTASGDGSLHFWDITKPQAPLMVYQEHLKEAYSLDWSQTRDHQLFISASWDTTLKLWDPNRRKSIVTMTGHEANVYQCAWSPHLSGCVASVSGDGTLRMWNTTKESGPSMTIHAVDGEALSCDWCKYNQNIIATAGTDARILGWDLRQPRHPVFVLTGHGYPVRRVKFSPFNETQLASVSYDFTTRLWDHSVPSPCLEVMESHTEFVYGLDFSNHQESVMADCAWDQTIGIYNMNNRTLPLNQPL
ncbi:peroxisomal targeting signal 2 receptor-like isoform X2 [Homarus americanus]|nr:peroxisomal targeting signal 2 receptor-like isoform X2 [Homarus americanus]XP_042218481.1 peroxisomal targeting signal 2 receptor-like isoform X2 [Homarus americanus]XP_042218482.1 peroxisomal targeting signal 2 receptor-like isoform X2 [Homarus americanus]XP_042218483.1 peroxisomal targeting signal 2 receptor-like isoform X2 [Homarus americanus]XP_042218484.1 peroxisomal targeting signal 2 receptor-like isoform X2 [Homarus americanus]XP_042218485.1 peroxisomal targeting signal 2 receptor-